MQYLSEIDPKFHQAVVDFANHDTARASFNYMKFDDLHDILSRAGHPQPAAALSEYSGISQKKAAEKAEALCESAKTKLRSIIGVGDDCHFEGDTNGELKIKKDGRSILLKPINNNGRLDYDAEELLGNLRNHPYFSENGHLLSGLEKGIASKSLATLLGGTLEIKHEPFMPTPEINQVEEELAETAQGVGKYLDKAHPELDTALRDAIAASEACDGKKFANWDEQFASSEYQKVLQTKETLNQILGISEDHVINGFPSHNTSQSKYRFFEHKGYLIYKGKADGAECRFFATPHPSGEGFAFETEQVADALKQFSTHHPELAGDLEGVIGHLENALKSVVPAIATTVAAGAAATNAQTKPTQQPTKRVEELKGRKFNLLNEHPAKQPNIFQRAWNKLKPSPKTPKPDKIEPAVVDTTSTPIKSPDAATRVASIPEDKLVTGEKWLQRHPDYFKREPASSVTTTPEPTITPQAVEVHTPTASSSCGYSGSGYCYSTYAKFEEAASKELSWLERMSGKIHGAGLTTKIAFVVGGAAALGAVVSKMSKDTGRSQVTQLDNARVAENLAMLGGNQL